MVTTVGSGLLLFWALLEFYVAFYSTDVGVEVAGLRIGFVGTAGAVAMLVHARRQYMRPIEGGKGEDCEENATTDPMHDCANDEVNIGLLDERIERLDRSNREMWSSVMDKMEKMGMLQKYESHQADST